MNFLLVLVYGISLSMDAFAVAVCKGLALKKVTLRDGFIVGAYFGIFQGLMPLAGYFLASYFKDYIEDYDHWIAFALLLYIGGKMIWESLHKGSEADKEEKNPLGLRTMFVMAIATSIDSFAVGVAFFCDGMPVSSNWPDLGIFISVCVIAFTTFVLSAVGVKLGRIVGSKFRSHAELIGGVVLILLGVKILVEHTMNISLLGI